MYCHNCGNEIAIAMKFCPGCGSAQAPQSLKKPTSPPSSAISAADLAAEFKTRFGTLQANKMKPITFYRSAGTVLEKESRTETHIHSSGGHFTGDHRGGSYSPVHVHSTNQKIDKAWYETEDGEESWVQMVNRSAPRQGHRISVISAKVAGEEKHKIVAVINHTTGELERFTPNIVSRTDTAKGCMTLIIAVVCVIAGYVIPNSYFLGYPSKAIKIFGNSLSLLGIAAFLYSVFGGFSTKKQEVIVNCHIDQIIKWCQQMGVAL